MIPRAVERVIHYYAWDTVANALKSGDSGNHTLQVVKDGVISPATNSPSAMGILNKITLTDLEMDGKSVALAGVSSAADIVIIPVIIISDDETLDKDIFIPYTAWDAENNTNKTGDVDNHSISVGAEGVDSAADNTPVELSAVDAPGLYGVLVEDTENVARFMSVFGTSSTPDVNILPINYATDPGRYSVTTAPNDSIRERIIDILQTRFETILISNGYKTDLGSNVIHWNRVEVPQGKLPHLGWDDAEAEEIRTTVGQVDNALEITCYISVQTKSDLYAARADLIQAIGADLFMSGLAGNTTTPTEVGDAQQMDRKMWMQQYRFVIEYPTDQFDEYNQ